MKLLLCLLTRDNAKPEITSIKDSFTYNIISRIPVDQQNNMYIVISFIVGGSREYVRAALHKADRNL
jgi:hypothetical protein